MGGEPLKIVYFTFHLIPEPARPYTSLDQTVPNVHLMLATE